MKKLLLLPLLAIFVMCRNGATDKNDGVKKNEGNDSAKLQSNSLQFKLNMELKDRKGKLIFKKGDYTLSFHAAYVKSGAYSGLELIFRSKEKNGDYYQLRFEFPSSRAFGVRYEKGEIIPKMSRTPFVLTERDFLDAVNNRYGRKQPAYVELSSYLKQPDGSFQSPSVVFTIFFLNVTKAVFGKTDITMKSTFSAETDSEFEMLSPKGMRLDGAFKIVKQPCLNQKVD